MMKAVDTRNEIYRRKSPASSIPYEDLSPEQREYVDSPDALDVHHAAMSGWGRERIAGDMRKHMWLARAAVAATTGDEQLMEKLSRDPDQHVRAAIASRGLFPERMAEDRSPLVRESLAESQDRRALLDARKPAPSISTEINTPLPRKTRQVNRQTQH